MTQLPGGGRGGQWDNDHDRSNYPRHRMGGARFCPAATAPCHQDSVGTTSASILVDRHRQHRESGRKRPTRGGEEDTRTTTAECNGDGPFRGWSVAVIAVITVVVVRCLP